MMISFEEALKTVKNSIFTLGTEYIPFTHSLNRVTAENVCSDIEMPPFNKSAVDGFAYKREDIDQPLIVIEVVQAGKIPGKIVEKGQCTQIMTGAPVPEGADSVVPVEDIECIGQKIHILKKDQKTNISYKAEDVIIGQQVLKKGTLIKPQHIAVMASVGYTNALCYKIPNVGIISTGNELVEPEHKPKPSQIRNSNSYQLMAQTTAMGLKPRYYGIAEDTIEDTSYKIQKAVAENDVILLTGGVSVGEFDFVADVIKELGFNILFDSIAVTPGKPTTFAVKDKQFCFGLPGNPVSSFVQFELLVKTLLFGMQGLDFSPPNIKLPMGIDFNRKNTNRRYFIPAKIKNAEVFPVEYHGSGHIHALSEADCLITLPQGLASLKKGEPVDVRQF
jgi:molybdopterin molybdotransferase